MKSALLGLTALCLAAVLALLLRSDPMDSILEYEGEGKLAHSDLGAVESATRSHSRREGTSLPDREPLESGTLIQVSTDEIGFYGSVISPEISLDELWVRLNILDLTQNEEFACIPDDFTTWLFANKVHRSKPIRVSPDGSFRLLGEPPAEATGYYRRYVIEVSIDGPEAAWPKIGKQELLPVALHWIGKAENGNLHKLPVLHTSRPFQISVRARLASESPLQESHLKAELSLSRADTQDSYSFEPEMLFELAVDLDSGLETVTPHPFPDSLHLTSIGPTWQTRVWIFPEGASHPIQPRESPSPVKLDQDRVIALDFAPMSFVYGRIEGKLPGTESLTTFLDRVDSREVEAKEERVPPFARFQEQARVRFLPVFDQEFRQLRSFTPPTNPDLSLVFMTKNPEAFLDPDGVWLAMGWIESGAYSLTARNSTTGQTWTSREFELLPHAIQTIQLASVRDPLMQLVLPNDISPKMVHDVLAYDSQGQHLDVKSGIPIALFRMLDLAKLPKLTIPHQASSVYVIARNSKQARNETHVLSVEVPTEGAPKGGLQVAQTESEFQLQSQGESTWIHEIVIRPKHATFAVDRGTFLSLTLTDLPTRHTIRGLPAGDYLAELRLHPGGGKPVYPLPENYVAQTKTVEFSVN